MYSKTSYCTYTYKHTYTISLSTSLFFLFVLDLLYRFQALPFHPAPPPPLSLSLSLSIYIYIYIYLSSISQLFFVYISAFSLLSVVLSIQNFKRLRKDISLKVKSDKEKYFKNIFFPDRIVLFVSFTNRHEPNVKNFGIVIILLFDRDCPQEDQYSTKYSEYKNGKEIQSYKDLEQYGN